MAVISIVGERDLAELLPLMRAYCDFYDLDPPREALLHMSRALIADPEHEGFQLIARDESDGAIGFATVFLTWATSSASRIGVMNDLFVQPDARGEGTAGSPTRSSFRRRSQAPRGASPRGSRPAPVSARRSGRRAPRA